MLIGLTHSLEIAAIVGSLSLVISTFMAIFLRNSSSFCRMLLYSYYCFPDIIIAFSFLSFFSACRIPIGFFSLIFSYVVIGVFISTWCLLRSFDATKAEDSALEEVAQDLGATRAQVIYRIIIPRIYSSVITTTAYVISVIVLDDVVLAGILSGASVSTLPVILLSSMRHGIDRKLNAFATLVMCFVSLCAALYSKLYFNNSRDRND